jgi:hypothetical protein
MLYRLVGLLGCALTFASCIVTHRDFPAVNLESEPLPPKDLTLYYRVEPITYFKQAKYKARTDFFYDFPSAPEDYDELRRVFAETGMFRRTIATSIAPPKGVYCSVSVEYRPRSELGEFFLSLSQASATLLPSYSESSGHVVRFDLYVDMALRKSYWYEMSRKEAIWFVLLPFVWVNAFTHSPDDAFRATAYQFFLDADRDGYLQDTKPYARPGFSARE